MSVSKSGYYKWKYRRANPGKKELVIDGLMLLLEINMGLFLAIIMFIYVANMKI